MGMRSYIFRDCLYFTLSSLARSITRLAEEEFGILGISPSHAFLLMYVYEHPGIMQKNLSEQLNLDPSTVTRFLDLLAYKGWIERKAEGKTALIFLTPDGEALLPPLEKAWDRLVNRYSQILGQEESAMLTLLVAEAVTKLEGPN